MTYWNKLPREVLKTEVRDAIRRWHSVDPNTEAEFAGVMEAIDKYIAETQGETAMVEPPEFEDYGKPEELHQRPPGVPAFISGLLHSLILLVIVSALLFILVWLWQLILDMM